MAPEAGDSASPSSGSPGAAHRVKCAAAERSNPRASSDRETRRAPAGRAPLRRCRAARPRLPRRRVPAARRSRRLRLRRGRRIRPGPSPKSAGPRRSGGGEQEMRDLVQDRIGLGAAVERRTVPVEARPRSRVVNRHAEVARQRQRLAAMRSAVAPGARSGEVARIMAKAGARAPDRASRAAKRPRAASRSSGGMGVRITQSPGVAEHLEKSSPAGPLSTLAALSGGGLSERPVAASQFRPARAEPSASREVTAAREPLLRKPRCSQAGTAGQPRPPSFLRAGRTRRR